MGSIAMTNEELIKMGKSFDELIKIKGFESLTKFNDSIKSFKDLSNFSSFDDLSKSKDFQR